MCKRLAIGGRERGRGGKKSEKWCYSISLKKIGGSGGEGRYLGKRVFGNGERGRGNGPRCNGEQNIRGKVKMAGCTFVKRLKN